MATKKAITRNKPKPPPVKLESLRWGAAGLKVLSNAPVAHANAVREKIGALCDGSEYLDSHVGIPEVSNIKTEQMDYNVTLVQMQRLRLYYLNRDIIAFAVCDCIPRNKSIAPYGHSFHPSDQFKDYRPIVKECSVIHAAKPQCPSKQIMLAVELIENLHSFSNFKNQSYRVNGREFNYLFSYFAAPLLRLTNLYVDKG